MEIRINGNKIVEVCNTTLQKLEELKPIYDTWYSNKSEQAKIQQEKLLEKNDKDWKDYRAYVCAKEKWENSSKFTRGKFMIDPVERPNDWMIIVCTAHFPEHRIDKVIKQITNFKHKAQHAAEVILSDEDLEIFAWIEHEVVKEIEKEMK